LGIPANAGQYFLFLQAARGRRGERLTAAHKNLVRSVLISKLRCIALARLKLDGNRLAVEQVGSLENDTKGTLSDLLADPVVDADDVGRRRSHCDGIDVELATGRWGCDARVVVPAPTK
jgi:hypothetical protein